MRRGNHKGALAQLVEHLHGMQGVSGSNPLCSISSPLRSQTLFIDPALESGALADRY